MVVIAARRSTVVKCHLDIESFSEAPLTKIGVYKYAEHSSTEILCICWAFDDGPVDLWIPYDDIPPVLAARITTHVKHLKGRAFISSKVPQALIDHAANHGEFRAHNSQFERVMLNGSPGKKINFPKTKRTQWICTAAKAAVHSLPRDLERLAIALGTPHQKQQDGKGAMMQIVKPRKASKHNPDTRWTPENTPDRFFQLYTYCVDDVLTERDCDHVVPDLSKAEQKIFMLDQIINDRGWLVDVERIADVQYLIAIYKKRLVRRMVELTGLKPTQTQKLAEWVRSAGVDMENLQAQSVVDALKRKDLPQNVRWVLRIYSLHNMKAPAKYSAMERAACSDGVLRGMFRFCGASTGRWSSQFVQLQNLFRPIITDAATAIDAFRERSISWIKMLYEQNPMKIFASCVRGMLIPRQGHDLLFADYNSIEARIVAWLAGQQDILKIFATHGLVYEYTAARMFGMATGLDTLKLVKKLHPMGRFLGKIAVLALGYQGGGAAFVKMAKQFGVDVDFERGERFKYDWRAANPYVVQMWENLNEAAINAVENPGVTYKTNKLMFRVVGDYLYMRLPSKRKLAYYKPWVSRGELRFWGIDTYTRQWAKCSTYGGKLLQNAAEGIARDLMTNGMMKLHATGIYPILGTIHDEIVAEPKEGVGSVSEVCKIICDKPAWAKGLPVHAEGKRAKRYAK